MNRGSGLTATKRVWARFLAICLLGSVVACTSAGVNGGSPNAPAVTQRVDTLPTLQSGAPTPVLVENRVGPLDVLEVKVFQVDELDRTVKVGANGEITLPLIGSVVAGGKTVSELETEIAAKLNAKYLQSAQVSVLVKEANSQQATVDGAVLNPGLVPLTGQTTLLQAIAISGGLAPGAAAGSILVFRNVGEQRMAAKFNLTAIRKGTAEDPVLVGGDVVVVDKSGLRGAFEGVRDNLPMFGIFSALLL